MTGASVGLGRDLNTVSRLGLDFAVANQEDVDEIGDTSREDIDRMT